MKLRRVLLLSVLMVVFPSAVTLAVTTDPVLTLGKGFGSFPVGLEFSFSSETGTSPATSPCVVGETTVEDCTFQNASGFDIGTMTFFWGAGQTAPFFCVAEAYFANPGVVNEDQTGCTFSGEFSPPPIDGPIGSLPPNVDFSISIVGFTGPLTISVTSTPVPEPGTLALLFTGLGTLAARRRWRAKRRP